MGSEAADIIVLGLLPLHGAFVPWPRMPTLHEPLLSNESWLAILEVNCLRRGSGHWPANIFHESGEAGAIHEQIQGHIIKELGLILVAMSGALLPCLGGECPWASLALVTDILSLEWPLGAIGVRTCNQRCNNAAMEAAKGIVHGGILDLRDRETGWGRRKVNAGIPGDHLQDHQRCNPRGAQHQEVLEQRIGPSVRHCSCNTSCGLHNRLGPLCMGGNSGRQQMASTLSLTAKGLAMFLRWRKLWHLRYAGGSPGGGEGPMPPPAAP